MKNLLPGECPLGVGPGTSDRTVVDRVFEKILIMIYVSEKSKMHSFREFIKASIILALAREECGS